MFITGRTETGVPILGNVFVQCESRGVQLETIVQVLDAQGYLIDWIEFYEDAMEANWLHSTTINKMKYALEDVKGQIYCQEVMFRLLQYLKVKYEAKN